ncbi:MFS transporter [Bacteroides sedimenti]|uniref:MFS transporter n=1 Tax=Bacteroides sedimenti TaxID=2136147 RepID=A0ABN6Z0W4_9BACE
MTQQKKNYALPIAMMFALFAMISFVTGLTNPLGIIVKNQFNAANWMTQLGNAANFIAYLFMGIPAGMLLKKIGYKKTALLAIAVGFFGVSIQYVSGLASSFGIYLSGAFISGFSMCMLNTVVNPMLNTLGGGGKKGNQLIQFGGSLNSISATIVPILVGYLIGDAARAQISDAAPALFIAMGIFALAFIVLFTMNIPEPYGEEEAKKEVKEKHSAMSFRHFVLGTVAIFLYVGIEVGIPNFVNLFLTTAKDAEGAKGFGMDTAMAGTIVGTYWFLMMIGRLVGGSIGGKISSKVQLTTVSTLALIFLVIGIFAPIDTTVSMPVFKSNISFGTAIVPINVMFFVLCGLCTSVMWGGIFNLAVEGLGKYTSMGSGIFMVMVCGGGILPLIQGGLADITSSYMTSYWVIFAAICFILYYALVGCKNVNKDIPVE